MLQLAAGSSMAASSGRSSPSTRRRKSGRGSPTTKQPRVCDASDTMWEDELALRHSQRQLDDELTETVFASEVRPWLAHLERKRGAQVGTRLAERKWHRHANQENRAYIATVKRKHRMRKELTKHRIEAKKIFVRDVRKMQRMWMLHLGNGMRKRNLPNINTLDAPNMKKVLLEVTAALRGEATDSVGGRRMHIIDSAREAAIDINCLHWRLILKYSRLPTVAEVSDSIGEPDTLFSYGGLLTDCQLQITFNDGRKPITIASLSDELNAAAIPGKFPPPRPVRSTTPEEKETAVTFSASQPELSSTAARSTGLHESGIFFVHESATESSVGQPSAALSPIPGGSSAEAVEGAEASSAEASDADPSAPGVMGIPSPQKPRSLTKQISRRVGGGTSSAEPEPEPEQEQEREQEEEGPPELVYNVDGCDSPHTVDPELWNIDAAEVDLQASYSSGGQLWYLQSRALERIRDGKPIAGWPINPKATQAKRRYIHDGLPPPPQASGSLPPVAGAGAGAVAAQQQQQGQPTPVKKETKKRHALEHVLDLANSWYMARGHLNRNWFRTYLATKSGGRYAPFVDWLCGVEGARMTTDGRARRDRGVFRIYDADHSGTIELDELQNAVHE